MSSLEQAISPEHLMELPPAEREQRLRTLLEQGEEGLQQLRLLAAHKVNGLIGRPQEAGFVTWTTYEPGQVESVVASGAKRILAELAAKNAAVTGYTDGYCNDRTYPQAYWEPSF